MKKILTTFLVFIAMFATLATIVTAKKDENDPECLHIAEMIADDIDVIYNNPVCPPVFYTDPAPGFFDYGIVGWEMTAVAEYACVPIEEVADYSCKFCLVGEMYYRPYPGSGSWTEIFPPIGYGNVRDRVVVECSEEEPQTLTIAFGLTMSHPTVEMGTTLCGEYKLIIKLHKGGQHVTTGCLGTLVYSTQHIFTVQ